MKKKMKPILFTMFILAAVTAGGFYFLLSQDSGPTGEFQERMAKAQNDLEENRSYRYDLDESAIPLATSGEKKNVLNFEHDVVYDVQQSNRDRERLEIGRASCRERVYVLV